MMVELSLPLGPPTMNYFIIFCKQNSAFLNYYYECGVFRLPAQLLLHSTNVLVDGFIGQVVLEHIYVLNVLDLVF